MKAGMLSDNNDNSVVVILALMSHGQNRNGLVVLDLEQGHISCGAKRNYELSQKRIIG